LEKLRVAIAYGADAVYIGGQRLGLRAAAGNFSREELAEGIAYAHARGVKVYVTANIFAHNADLDGVGEYFRELEVMGADALIISDPGIFSIARRAVGLDIHISTQANTTNYASAAFWSGCGAKRLVLARELSFLEIAQIRQNTPVGTQLEAFVHGAMCIAYSGRCLLSSYLTGRDSNRGECAQPCRWSYHLTESARPGEYYEIAEDERGTYIMNSKDLCMAGFLPELIACGIDSFKIEGRMKSPYYVATTVKAYREAIDDYCADPARYERRKAHYLEELAKNSHRGFTTGFYNGKPDADGQRYDSGAYIRDYDFVGIVLDYDANTETALVEQRNKFSVGEKIEFFTAKGEGFTQTIDEMRAEDGVRLLEAPHPQQRVRVKVQQVVGEFDMLRRVR
jgi:putative protease